MDFGGSILMFMSIWCDGSRLDLLYVLELLTRSYGKDLVKNARGKFVFGERMYRFRESDKNESMGAQR